MIQFYKYYYLLIYLDKKLKIKSYVKIIYSKDFSNLLEKD